MDDDLPGPSAQQLGRLLESLREKARLSIPEFAERAKLSVDRIVKIENGLIDPNLADLERYADVLSLPISVLFRKWEFSRN